jgi:hypothetical protein
MINFYLIEQQKSIGIKNMRIYYFRSVISMAKNTINILCPSGHRRKAQMAPNSNLLQVRKYLYRLFIMRINYISETVNGQIFFPVLDV